MSPLAAIALLWTLAGPASPSEGLAPGVALLPGSFAPGSQPDGNTVLIRAPGGLIVVDTGRHADHTRAILDLASAWRQPVAVVVNTHWHLDHVAGNPAVRQAHPGVEVVGSDAIEGALKGFLADYRRQLETMLEKAGDPAERRRWRDEIARIDAGRALEPDRKIRETTILTLAGRRVEIGFAPSAVTAGDVWLFDAESGVLAAGDLVTLPVPLLDTACPAGWRAALARLAEIPFRILVPGHGRPMQRAEFERWRAAFEHLLSCAGTDASASACIDGWVADLGPVLPEGERPFARELLGYYVPELLRASPAKVARRCEGRAPPSR